MTARAVCAGRCLQSEITSILYLHWLPFYHFEHSPNAFNDPRAVRPRLSRQWTFRYDFAEQGQRLHAETLHLARRLLARIAYRA